MKTIKEEVEERINKAYSSDSCSPDMSDLERRLGDCCVILALLRGYLDEKWKGEDKYCGMALRKRGRDYELLCEAEEIVSNFEIMSMSGLSYEDWLKKCKKEWGKDEEHWEMLHLI